MRGRFLPRLVLALAYTATILLTHRLPYHGRLLLWWLLVQIGPAPALRIGKLCLNRLDGMSK